MISESIFLVCLSVRFNAFKIQSSAMHPVFIHFLKGGGIGVAEYLKHSIREGFSLGAVQLTDPVLDGAVQNDALAI